MVRLTKIQADVLGAIRTVSGAEKQFAEVRQIAGAINFDPTVCRVALLNLSAHGLVRIEEARNPGKGHRWGLTDLGRTAEIEVRP